MARKPVSQATRRVFAATVESLDSLAPSDWRVEIARRSDDGGAVRVDSSDGVSGELRVIVSRDLSPREVVALPEPEEATIVAAEWLSPRSRELLADIGYGYVDLTGNVGVVVSRPGIVFRTDGAQRDPSPKPVPRLHIRGPRAWALLRTLAEVQPPYGVSDLANAIDSDPGYVSRLLAALADELLISRVARGPVEHVEWEAMLRQIVSSYSLLEANETTNWVASSGAEQFVEDLASTNAKTWAVTGSFAASRLVSVAAPEIAVVYANDPERIATLARLSQVRNGGNVVIARPYDQIVFERTWARDNVVYASPAQIAVDCLTGPGRMPAEGEALLEWLQRKAPRWQAPSLTAAADGP
ncbi:MAG: hypothetical protein OEW30_20360 [Acidimicrobiia bacterium]|nr:hypothetical protein [Acidimicrobiia bacterium]